MNTPIDRAAAADFELRFRIRSWAVWAPGLVPHSATLSLDASALPADDGSAPTVDFLPAMLRRRLGRAARMALHVAHQIVPEHASLPSIFVSRHGELQRTSGLLHTLAAGELPSPASFSLSVHNATAGIHAIARQDTAPSTAIAAGEESLLWALLEASQRLEHGTDDAILIVSADDAMPREYDAFASATDRPFALALVVEAGSDMGLAWCERTDASESPTALPVAFARWCAGEDALQWHGERLSITGVRRA